MNEKNFVIELCNGGNVALCEELKPKSNNHSRIDTLLAAYLGRKFVG